MFNCTTGFYPSLDMITRPQQLASVASAFGYLPGLELGAALLAGLQQGSEPICLDASVRMSEAWVAGAAGAWQLQASVRV
jgi:hypothetical protein